MIALIGKNGQIGRHLEKKLDAQKLIYQAYSRESFDLTDHHTSSNILASIRPSIIINCAAFTKVPDAETSFSEAIAVNHLAVKNLVNISNKINSRLIHISTDYVFDGASTSMYFEDSVPNPINKYGLSKYLGDREVLENCKNFILIRTSWVLSEYGNNFLKTIFLKKNKNPLNVICDQYGTPSFADDIAESILRLILNKEFDKKFFNNEVINISSGDKCSWYDIAEEILKETDKILGSSYTKNLKMIKTEEYNNQFDRPKNSALNNDKAMRLRLIEKKGWKGKVRDLLSTIIKE